ncbi:sodium/sugar symporter [Salegentibacter maritimus]|uniref:sodium/sugar symporter n=1 Tax=Salegentibacter maritimus TaxID=2794347 RepID=UPI0018E483BF|nr:sodium/sugar symporter [Salegentibacter maritimus]MBI6117773.1 sodium/sugar symporter [Salegentibacter maritimus]
MEFGLLDQIIFAAYALLIVGVGLYVSRGKGDSSEGYFLADKSLPWWAIGASLIAANISAEQFIGMSGSGFAIGLAIASYEWMAAITLLLVGKFFLPIFIDKGLYTIPEFIEVRYGSNLKTILAVFWICLFVFVNLTSVLYLGATALDTIMGTGDGSFFIYAIIGLAFFAAAYSLYGGLSAVAWTDVVQVVLLIIGGLITTFIALSHVTEDGGVISGMVAVYEQVPEKFSMILDKGEIITPNGKDAWWDLPGLAVLIGGLWVANLYYWGFNQYIIQRTLAAKSLRESQKGIILAGFLKLIVPLIVVIPGIIAFVMNTGPDGAISLDFTDSSFFSDTGNIINDNAAPWLIQEFVPAGLKGLVLAALAAAIVSSVASMLNSTATIFTMDIYKPYFGKNSSEKNLVKVGRLSATAALVIAVILAPQLKNLGQVFQYIQEYTGVVSPGILAVFMLGLFWKKTTNKAAIFGVLASIPIALFFKVGPNGWIDSAIFVTLPFMHQMMITWLLTMLIMVVISLAENKGRDHEKGIKLSSKLFNTGPAFNIGAFAILLIVTMLYAMFW